jgi:hypothetical protein
MLLGWLYNSLDFILKLCPFSQPAEALPSTRMPQSHYFLA